LRLVQWFRAASELQVQQFACGHAGGAWPYASRECAHAPFLRRAARVGPRYTGAAGALKLLRPIPQGSVALC
jgi:hypothetical protein